MSAFEIGDPATVEGSARAGAHSWTYIFGVPQTSPGGRPIEGLFNATVTIAWRFLCAFSRQQHIPDALDVNVGLLCALGVSSLPLLAGIFSCQVAQQILAFFEHPQRNPKSLLDLFGLAREQCGGGKRMAGVAAISLDIGLVELPEDAAAVWAGTGLGRRGHSSRQRRSERVPRSVPPSEYPRDKLSLAVKFANISPTGTIWSTSKLFRAFCGIWG